MCEKHLRAAFMLVSSNPKDQTQTSGTWDFVRVRFTSVHCSPEICRQKYSCAEGWTVNGRPHGVCVSRQFFCSRPWRVELRGFYMGHRSPR